MKVTKVFFKKFESNAMLGFADVYFSLDGSEETHMRWKGVKLFKGKNGYFTAMPAELDKKGAKDDNGNPKYWPIISFEKSEEASAPQKLLSDAITNAVVKAYEEDGRSDKVAKPKPAKKAVNDTTIGDDDIPF